MTRLLLAATALGTLTGLALTYGTYGAVGVAVCAGAVIMWCLVRAIQTDRRRERDNARHPRSDHRHTFVAYPAPSGHMIDTGELLWSCAHPGCYELRKS